MFQELNISNVSIFLIDCQSYTFLLMNIIISDRILYIIILCHKCKKDFFNLSHPIVMGKGAEAMCNQVTFIFCKE